LKGRILILALVLAIVPVMPMVALADNVATQKASATAATTILVKAQDCSTDITTITFPEGITGTDVYDPYNDVDGESNPQALNASSAATPVVTLVNTGDVAYKINIETSLWTPEGVVASEYYAIKTHGATCALTEVSNPLTLGGITDTTISIAAPANNSTANQKDLYLKITLGGTTGQEATSTLTILGEAQ
jgi:hypothetical protein